MLGDSERPQNLGRFGGGIGMRHLPDGLGGDAGQFCAALKCVRLDGGLELLEALGRARNEVLVVQVSRDDLAGNGVRHGDIAADFEPEPHVGELGRRGTTRIDGEHGGAVVDALQQMMEEDRVCFASIRTPQQDDVGLFDFFVRRRAAACSENCGQTDHRRSVSSSVTGVDVIRPHHHPRKLLGGVVHFVGRLRTAEHAEAVHAGSNVFTSSEETFGNTIECFVPCCRHEFAVDPDHRRGQSRPRQMLFCLVFSHEAVPLSEGRTVHRGTVLRLAKRRVVRTIGHDPMSVSNQLL